MGNETQLERYKRLLSFIDQHLTEDINIEKVEAVCHYSYRNINRIFQALHQETIGKYVKRLRLEKAAQYLKYSNTGVSDIAYEVGFEDRAAFSKAFKNRYGCSPSVFRLNSEALREDIQHSFLPPEGAERPKLQFEIEVLPAFHSLYLEYRGNAENSPAVDAAWEELITYAVDKGILTAEPILMTEIIDDLEISDQINCRYNFGLAFTRALPFSPEGLFRTKSHQLQKYVKFVHRGSPESAAAYYQQIYAFWMLDVGLEFQDLPTLEFYPNLDENLAAEDLVSEIYIPVQ